MARRAGFKIERDWRKIDNLCFCKSAILGLRTSAENTMATHVVMDHTGNSRHVAEASAVEAEAPFNNLTGAGFTSAKRMGEARARLSKNSIRRPRRCCSFLHARTADDVGRRRVIRIRVDYERSRKVLDVA